MNDDTETSTQDANLSEMEDLAGRLAILMAENTNPESTKEAHRFARVLAVVQIGVEDVLSQGLSEWTLKHGPVYIDGQQDQAYGHWEKKTTTVGDESGLWAFLEDKVVDINHHKRPDLVTLKALMTGEEPIEGLEEFIGTSTTYAFGFKKNLTKSPRTAAGMDASQAPVERKAKPSYGLGVQGVTTKAHVKKIEVGPLPPRPEAVAPVPVMPPARVTAKV